LADNKKILISIPENLLRELDNAVKEEGTNIVRNVATGGEISGEVNAAIAMALYMYQSELHDLENTVLTAQKVSRTYSPWSSKIYALRRYPR